MPLAANATFNFDSYTIEDTGLRMHFTCPNPGAGQVTDYNVLLLDSEISALSTTTDFRNLVASKLARKYRATSLSTKIDSFIGQSFTV